MTEKKADIENNDNGQENIKSFSCQNCGGRMKWHIRKQEFMCMSCSTPAKLDLDNSKVVEHSLLEYTNREHNLKHVSEVELRNTVVKCRTCGAEVEFGETQTATLCPMCGSSQVDNTKQTLGIPPDGVVPFKIDYDDAQQRFKGWVKKRWFAPNTLKVAYQMGKLNGAYVPFWTYDVDVSADYRGLGGVQRSVKGLNGKMTITTDWRSVSGTVSKEYNDYPIFSGNNNDNIINKILPFNTQDGSYPYSEEFLSGFCSEHYVFSAIKGFDKAKVMIKSEMENAAEDNIVSSGYSSAKVQSINLEFGESKYKQILAPVWLSNFVYKEKHYTYAINGDTGKVNGERPYSIIKIASAIILVIAIVLALLAFDLWSDDYSLNCEEITQISYSDTFNEETVYEI